MQRLHVHPVTLVQLRQLRFEPGGNRIHFRLRLGQRDAVLEPGHDEHVVPAPIEVKRLGNRRPDVRRRVASRRWKLEVGRHDPDHGIGLATDRHRSADHGSIATEPVAPQPLADHDDLAVARTILIGRKDAAGHRRDAHDREEV